MISAIIHQVFWTLLAFFLFLGLMRLFVIRNVEAMQQKRMSYIESLNTQINGMRDKTKTLKEVTQKILHEEIPTKQRFYVEKKLEPVLHELQIVELNEKDTIKERMAKHKVRHFTHQIATQDAAINQLKQLASVFSAKIEGKLEDKQVQTPSLSNSKTSSKANSKTKAATKPIKMPKVTRKRAK